MNVKEAKVVENSGLERPIKKKGFHPFKEDHDIDNEKCQNGASPRFEGEGEPGRACC